MTFLITVTLAKLFIRAKKCRQTVSTKSVQKSDGKTCEEIKVLKKVCTKRGRSGREGGGGWEGGWGRMGGEG